MTIRQVFRRATLPAVAVVLAGLPAVAEEHPRVGITSEIDSVTVETRSGPVEIRRVQDPENTLEGSWARTSRPCPEFCIQPHQPAEGVSTIGELELLDKLQDPEVIVVDSRTPDWYAGGTIPGAINIPYTEAVDRMGDLGCEIDFDGWNCEGASEVALFCNGLWCGQSPAAIRRMIEAGFPAEKISYYRGGMQTWRLLGLTVTGGEG
ncbi:rhodanese-like domain-containing protein [Rhodosalinus halophilus]|uniref:Rhodanese-like domain-containing protein n=1 Tax=Rhodosalinus halophilus TaxID=2259333 RepID=A0A365U727_9RHOB|nr:rhodanese-like domain-containing protein [Rhodosalinus halophilus]RBI84016.1 rhodanese-like domain-containing protein [Rhodosalinus halophilus]